MSREDERMDERDERVLLLLGLLATQEQHTYRLNEFIERNLSRLSRMRKATAYALLERMERAGMVTSSTQEAGNRPARRLYAETADGQQRFMTMLRTILSRPEIVTPPGDIALMFIDHLDRAEALAAIEQRIAALQAEIEQMEAMPPHEVGIGVDLAIARRLALLRADRDWFSAVRERVTSDLAESAAFSAKPSDHPAG
jgi:DNA-binding PadR family transcriptional regulator